MFNVPVSLAGWDTIFGAAFGLIFVWVALYAKAVPQGDRRWWALVGLLAVLVLTSLLGSSELARVILTDAAAFVAVALVWTQGTPATGKAARTYLALMVPAVICIAAGTLLAGGGQAPPAYPLDRLATAALVVGFGLKLAMVPFYFWLPGVAATAAPMTTTLIVSIVDIAAFTELAQVRATAPWMFADHRGLWLAVALLSMFGGALLALAQRDVKRMLAFSTVDDMGYLLLGVALGPEIGLAGAMLAALSHALVKALLFGAVGVVEQKTGQPVTLDSRGLAARFPVSGAAFIVGALGVIGVPPLFGFAGRWRLYLAGAQAGGPALVLAMALATVVALLYYVRVVHRVWLGPAPEGALGGEPRLAATVMVVLMVAIVALGLAPGVVSGLAG